MRHKKIVNAGNYCVIILLLSVGNLNAEGRSRLNLQVSFHERNLEATETDYKLQEIMKISGILTIGGMQYQTEISDMEHLGELGSGTCGQVVKMKHKPSGKIIAVKVSHPVF